MCPFLECSEGHHISSIDDLVMKHQTSASTSKNREIRIATYAATITTTCTRKKRTLHTSPCNDAACEKVWQIAAANIVYTSSMHNTEDHSLTVIYLKDETRKCPHGGRTINARCTTGKQPHFFFLSVWWSTLYIESEFQRAPDGLCSLACVPGPLMIVCMYAV